MPLSEEQLQAMMGMSDIGGQEDELARQMALSEQLRSASQNIKRNDIGSNIGRAGYGIGSAISDYRNNQRPAEITAGKKSFLSDMLRRYKKPAGGGGYTPGTSAGDGLE